MSQNHEFVLYINNVQITGDNAIIKEIGINETIVDEIPQMKLNCVLFSEFLTTHPLTDGSPIRLEINNGFFKQVLNFRLYYFSASSNGSEMGLTYNIIAYHEALWKLSCIETNYYKSMSTDVFKRIAEKEGMGYDLDSSNDSQVWFSLNDNRINFLRQVCSHGWANKNSFFAWWVNRKGVLNYKNLTNRISKVPLYFLYDSNTDFNKIPFQSVPVQEITYVMENGINNFSQGYGKNHVNFNIVDNNIEENNPKSFYVNTEFVNVCKDSRTQESVNLGISSGNTHKNYNLAYAQNARASSLWSFSVSCVDRNFYDLDLGSCVYLDAKLDSKNNLNLYSGNYLISGIHIAIMSGNHVMSKLDLIRQGVSENTSLSQNNLKAKK